ncbi:PaaI family thioesterase [Wandonia haliotis]|uniref:PaaI family thioesterase n=1 Tax=Wandonia haliotis TaxID=574963 RepID=A0ABP3Y9T5_9FLAO
MESVRDLIIETYKRTNRFGDDLGMQLSIVQPGEIEYKLAVSDKHMATPVAAHGGVIATLMDGTLGVAALSLVVEQGKVVSTIELKLNFLSPARLGDTLIATGKVVQAGSRIIYAEGEIRNQKNELVAKGSGTFNAYPAEKAGIL